MHTGLRYDNWKIVFMEQRRARYASGRNPLSPCGFRRFSTSARTPYERADITSNIYYDWLMDHVFLLVPAQAYVEQFLTSFKSYAQRQKAATFNMDEVLQKLGQSGGSK